MRDSDARRDIPLQLTRAEAEALRGTVERLIRRADVYDPSEAAAPAGTSEARHHPSTEHSTDARPQA